jgi:diacylglycerol kinase family enzyme
VVFVNPGSRANRRDPGCAERFAGILGETGRVLAPTGVPALAEEARRVAQSAPAFIGIHGGDGTLHWTIGELIRAYGDRPLPPLALMSGGTMNVVASSLGIRVSPERLLDEVVAAQRAGRVPATVRRRCMKVVCSSAADPAAGAEVNYGFVFGTGLISNFLEEYYAKHGYGAARAGWILVRTFLSAVTTRRFSERVFRRFRGQVFVDGQRLPWPALVGVGAATVREVGLGFKLNHRADDDPDRFGVLAIRCKPLALMRDLAAVRQGRGIAPERAWSAVAERMLIEPEEGGCVYTIDGDLYRSAGPITVEVGPAFEFVRPSSARAAVEIRAGRAIP